MAERVKAIPLAPRRIVLALDRKTKFGKVMTALLTRSHVSLSKSTISACSLVCRASRDPCQEALYSQPFKFTDSALSEEILSIPSRPQGRSLLQVAPPIKDLSLCNVGLGMRDLVNLLRLLPSLDILAIHNPLLTATLETYEYKDDIRFSLTSLTITGKPSRWPVQIFALLVTKVLSIFHSIDHCEVYTGAKPTDPIQVSVSETTKPLLNISKMQLALPRDLLALFSNLVTGIVTIPILRNHDGNFRACDDGPSWPPPVEFNFQNEKIHVEHLTLVLPCRIHFVENSVPY